MNDSLDLEQLDKTLYGINRTVSLALGFEKDIKKQHKLSKINKLIAEAIKECRT